MFRVFFCPAPPTTAADTLSLHDALPISAGVASRLPASAQEATPVMSGPGTLNLSLGSYTRVQDLTHTDRKSTRLNSSHLVISYAVFCLKKKTNNRRKPYLQNTISEHQYV